jgi:hypothetical protein
MGLGVGVIVFVDVVVVIVPPGSWIAISSEVGIAFKKIRSSFENGSLHATAAAAASDTMSSPRFTAGTPTSGRARRRAASGCRRR